MGGTIKRRTFLRTLSLSSMTLIPGIEALGGLVSAEDRRRLYVRGHDLRFIDYACNILQFQNLLYLECYFLNVVHSAATNALFPLAIPDTHHGGKDKISHLHSYMVVRLPQQHISEEFKTIEELNSLGGKRVFAKSTISGYSFLVFEINFGLLKKPAEGLPLTAATLLNWNAPWFSLAVSENPDQELFDVTEVYDPPPPGDGLPPQINGYPLGHRGGRFSRNAFPQYTGRRMGNYPFTVHQEPGEDYYVTNDLTDSVPGPVTAIEAPYRLILSPKLPDKDAYSFYWTFSIPCIDTLPGSAELWTAKLQIRNNGLPAHIPKDPKAELNKKQQNNGQENMELMIIGSPDYLRRRFKLDFRSTNDEKCSFKRLPCAVDRSDLVALYMQNRIAARAPAISFSPLGISAYINFYNNNFENNGITLYQWDQQISYGRDQQVIVSRIVVDACFGLKMLHIQMTARETFQDQSLLVYREFVKPLDPEKDFSLFDSGDLNEYKDVNRKFNQPYKKIRFKDLRAVEIRPVAELVDSMKVMAATPGVDKSDNCDCELVNDKGESVVAFWPVTPDGKLVTWEMLYDDWHAEDDAQQPAGTGKCSCHQLFLLAGELANNSDDSFLFKAPDVDNKGQYLSFSDLYGKVFVPATDGQLAGKFQAYKDAVKSLITGRIGPFNQPWLQILQKTEDFELQKTELYRDFLDRSIAGAENLLRNRAVNILDRVMDEWNIFKRRALNAEKDILSLLDRLNTLLEGDKQGLPPAGFALNTINGIQTAIATLKARILQDIQASRQKALATIDDYKTQILNFWNRTRNALEDSRFVADLRTIYSDTQTRVQNYTNYFRQIQDLPSAVDSLGIEYAWAMFQSALPKGFVIAIQRDIQQYIDNIQAVFHEIQGVEENLRSRVEVFGAKVGYAVGKVEEELDDLKNKIKDDFAKAGKQGDEWEQEYNRLRKLYHEEVNEKMSSLKTEYILFRNNYRHFERDFDPSNRGAVVKQVFNFFDEHACFPQLHTAKVYVDRVNDLVHREIPLKVRYAKDYIENQVNNAVFQVAGNASRVFLEIKADGKELIRGAVREMGKELGGLVSPELAADFLTYAKDLRDTTAEMKNVFDSLKGDADAAIAQKLGDVQSFITDAKRTFNNDLDQYKDYLTQAKNNLVLLSKQAVDAYHEQVGEAQTALKQKEDEAKAYFQQLEAKIIGAIHIRDIIGDGAMLPRVDRQNNKIYYSFVTKKLISPPPNSIFSFTPQLNTGSGTVDANLALHFEKSLVDKDDYTAWTRLSNFTVGVFEERVIIGFQKLEMVSNNKVKNKVSVAIQDVHFQKELAFIESLSKNIQLPGTGLSLSIHPRDISIDFAYALPDISGGAFNFFNVKFHVGVIIPFPIGSNSSVSPITASFGINAPDDKFVLGVGIWGGRGHAVLETTPKYIKRVDIGMDYGGLLALNLGIAKGQAFLMAGVRFVYERDDFGRTNMELYCLLTCGGSVTVFGFITISVVFLLCLKYQNTGGKSSLYGIASVTYSIQIGFFKKSFTLSFSKRLYGSDNDSPPQDDYGYLEGTYRSDKLYHLAGYKDPQKDLRDEYVFGRQSLSSRYLRPESRRIFTIYRF